MTSSIEFNRINLELESRPSLAVERDAVHRVPLVGPLLRQPLLPVLDRALAVLRRDEAAQPIEELGLWSATQLKG